MLNTNSMCGNLKIYDFYKYYDHVMMNKPESYRTELSLNMK